VRTWGPRKNRYGRIPDTDVRITYTINPITGCWETNKAPKARKMWLKHKGAIPKGLWVLHHCDNNRCVNLDHLYLGTPKDNLQDAIIRGRAPQCIPNSK
jgi:hypothetical protein